MTRMICQSCGRIVRKPRDGKGTRCYSCGAEFVPYEPEPKPTPKRRAITCPVCGQRRLIPAATVKRTLCRATFGHYLGDGRPAEERTIEAGAYICIDHLPLDVPVPQAFDYPFGY